LGARATEFERVPRMLWVDCPKSRWERRIAALRYKSIAAIGDNLLPVVPRSAGEGANC
jgi:hypothetical protein